MEKATERHMQCQLSLEAGGSVRIVNGRGARLAVDSGLVWLTQEADRRDWMLGEGRSHRLEHDGVAIASALRSSRLTVSAFPRDRVGQLLAAAARLVTGRRRARLDSHALKDIGLESHHPTLAQCMHEERKEAMRLRAAPLGLL